MKPWAFFRCSGDARAPRALAPACVDVIFGRQRKSRTPKCKHNSREKHMGLDFSVFELVEPGAISAPWFLNQCQSSRRATHIHEQDTRTHRIYIFHTYTLSAPCTRTIRAHATAQCAAAVVDVVVVRRRMSKTKTPIRQTLLGFSRARELTQASLPPQQRRSQTNVCTHAKAICPATRGKKSQKE